MRIAQQPIHKRAEPMPVMDKLGSSALDGFGFKGHAQCCPVNGRNMDNLFFAGASRRRETYRFADYAAPQPQRIQAQLHALWQLVMPTR
jgi:hypothetical protein